MVWQVLKSTWLLVVSHLVKFYSLTIVNVQIFLLGNGEHVLILQEVNVSNELLCLEFTHKVLFFPVHHCYVTLFGPHYQVFSISCEVE